MAVPALTRPRLAVHLGWELMLLLAVLVVLGIAARQVPLFDDGRLLWSTAYLGLLASGFAFSLRLRTPNLAVVAAASTSMVVYSELAFMQDLPPGLAAFVAVLAAGVLGAVLALATNLLHAPTWAVTLAGQAVGALVVAGLANPEAIAAEPGATSGGGVVWFLAFLVVSVGGGTWLAMPAVRARLAATGGAEPLGHRARLLIGLTGSSLLAGVAGVVAIMSTGNPLPNPAFGTFPMFTGGDLIVVLGAVLLGGVSIGGDRAGVAGIALAVTLLAVTFAWLGLRDADASVVYLVLVLALLAGFAVRPVLTALTRT